MAYNTITLRVQDTTPDAVKPTSVTVHAWPLASNAGARLKRIKDSTGRTISGHVVHRASPTEIAAGVVDVVLPDPRDPTLNPTAFGWEVRVETNYFKQEPVKFGSTEITALASGGVLLYGKVAPVDAAAFNALATYASQADYLALLDTIADLTARLTDLETVTATPFVEDPVGSGLYASIALTEDPDGSGLYNPLGLTEDPAAASLYLIGA